LWMFDPHSIRRLKSFASMKLSADLVLIRLLPSLADIQQPEQTFDRKERSES